MKIKEVPFYMISLFKAYDVDVDPKDPLKRASHDFYNVFLKSKKRY